MALEIPQDFLWFAVFREGTRLGACAPNDLLQLRGTCRTARDQLDDSGFWHERYAQVCDTAVSSQAHKQAFLDVRRATAHTQARKLAEGAVQSAINAFVKGTASGAIVLSAPMVPLHLPFAPVHGALFGSYAAVLAPAWAAIASHLWLGPHRPILRILSAGAFALTAPVTMPACAAIGAASGAAAMTLLTAFASPVAWAVFAGESIASTGQCAYKACQLGCSPVVRYHTKAAWLAFGRRLHQRRSMVGLGG